MRTLDALLALPDVARLNAHAGQVLFYPRHTPPGLFVVVSGTVRRFADGTPPDAVGGERLDAAAGPFALPPPAELDGPAPAGAIAATDVEILFVPRSVVLSGGLVAAALETAGVAFVSMGESTAGPAPTATRRRAR